MKALMKTSTGYDNMELVDLPIPEATGDLVQIKVAYSGICGTDIHTFKGEYASSKPPLVLGHEFSGVVTAVGPDVTSVAVGDRVTSETTFSTCGHCPSCQEREYNICPERKGLGTQANGSMAEYVVNREESIHILPDNVSLLAASLTEPLACGAHAVVDKAHVSAGDVCVVFGAGTIGQVVAMVAKAQGATVIMAGLSQDKPRFDVAKSWGVDRCVDQSAENLEEIVQEYTDGWGADVVIECSGAARALASAFKIIKRKGVIVQEGIFAKEETPVLCNVLMNKEIEYVGSRTQNPRAWEISLALMAEGKVDVEKLITSVQPLADWRESFDKMAQGEGLKSVLACSDLADES